ncbi:MAG: LLM class F420-dependent oxidoreductase [Proteobacteria bacterium]|nr:LLM class F420-dependent oxidoreductase [Pseudomonadota bacterium]
MEIGVTIHSTDLTMSPVDVAREAEARGFASLYVPEHTHIPTSRRTAPPTGDGVLSEEYKRSLDPYIALAAAAAVTSKIRLGTGIALVAQHDAITLAKQLATLDLLSDGRLVLGIGYGWNHEEMENHGIDVKRRRALVREKMLAMQALWANEVAEFRGEFVSFEPSWQWPKPVQQPRPRVLIGGAAGPVLFDHVAEYGDGWMPIGGAGLRKALPDLRRAFEERGRDPASLHVVPMGVFPDAAKLDHYRDRGVTEVVLRLPSAPRDRVLPVLDDYAQYL